MLTPVNESTVHSSELQPVLWGLGADSVQAMFRNSHAPTVLMLLCAIACVWLVRDTPQTALLIVWAVTALVLTALRLISAGLFERASGAQQALPI